MTHEQRVNALYEFTRDVVKACSDANVLPDMVQIGHEIGNGLLWPDGRHRYDSGRGQNTGHAANGRKRMGRCLRSCSNLKLGRRTIEKMDPEELFQNAHELEQQRKSGLVNGPRQRQNNEADISFSC
jgi:hypothetical protein